MLPVLGVLAANGLGILANAGISKGVDWLKSFVKDKTGVDIEKAVLSEEELVSLKQLEMEHEEELLKLAIEDKKISLEETKAYLADTGDARSREIKITESQSSSWMQKNITPLLAVGIVSLTFWLFWWITLQDVNKLNNKDIVIYILGALSSIVVQVISYYFGSSKGSTSKDETIKAMSQGGNNGTS